MEPEEQLSDMELKIQALVDNELPADEIAPTLESIRHDPSLQREYGELLRLKRHLGPGPSSRISDEWLQKAQRKITRKISRGVGTILLIASYVALAGYALYTIVADPETPVLVSILIGSGVLGFVLLLSNAIMDRVRERKNDKYRGVIR
jgi:hypothetical protein